MFTGLGRRSSLGALLCAVLLVTALVVPLGPAPSYGSVGAPTVTRAAHHRLGLEARIERLGVVDSVTEVPGFGPKGTRFFRIWFRLPVDHDHPDGRHFRLRGTLLHRGTDRPLVLATSGYGLRSWQGTGPNEVTQLVRGNQLDLEHRFFRPSRPDRPRWARQLTIRQAAADVHLVVRGLKQIYGRPWLSTGASKGGMTMTYHRRFYPGDVAGTVAYVAPNDVVDDEDDAYADFLANVGGEAFADCRADLVAVQRRILEDRDWFVAKLEKTVGTNGTHLSLVGGADRAVEVAAIETYFAFWQYQPAEAACPEVPGAAATDQDIWEWVDSVLGWYFLTDEDTRYYVPYYYQAATQLGAPAPYEAPIADLLRYPGHDVPATFVPDDLEPLVHDATAMPDVDRWVRKRASRMLFVYGELDPWSAEPFSCGETGEARECVRYYAPEGNHGSKIGSLPGPDERAAAGLVRQWAGLSAKLPPGLVGRLRDTERHADLRGVPASDQPRP
ncbi:S28 family serine protease [Nocardioides humilatus]|uniref:S28 family serine protease n=1 Tax=Nocardioides humilatus TaxID=2607660 RepID=UPI00165EEE63|nr:S28 family serine protease [Nocardioides humilatus]